MKAGPRPENREILRSHPAMNSQHLEPYPRSALSCPLWGRLGVGESWAEFHMFADISTCLDLEMVGLVGG